jgi:ribosomal protein S18 acetylase RimI-like enzyme
LVQTDDNPNFHWGNFVLIDEPQGLDAGLDLFRRIFPTAQHLAIGVDGTAGEIPASARAQGLQAEVSVVLVADSHGVRAPAPSDAEIRVLAGDNDWAQLLELRGAGISSENPPVLVDQDFQRRRVLQVRALSEHGHGVHMGAFIGGNLVSALGVVSDGNRHARYQDVQTDPAFRRRGLAGWLVARGAEEARKRWRAAEMVIVADESGPAIGLYRTLGFVAIERQVEMEGNQRDLPGAPHASV